MGLAPLQFFTGLNLCLFGIFSFVGWVQEFFLCLLDNVPLHVDSFWSFIWKVGHCIEIIGIYLHYGFWCQSTAKTTTSRSQVREPRKLLGRVILLVLCLTSLILHSYEVGGEGYVTSMGDVEAAKQLHDQDPWLAAKIHGLEPRQIHESIQTSKHRAVCKRSFLRARNRASIHGHTWYRGRIFTASQLGVSMKVPHAAMPPKNVLPPKPVQRRRLTCFSWNCNGLPPDHWDFLTQWMKNQTIDIVLLQETHWRFTRDWIMDHYLAVHSGATSEKAGLLCLISQKDLFTI